ncbi:S-adenosyl-L-methionine-dependent methyltransferase [Clathrospora elynae]|uniref:DNA (cytosine-5-)-methyltransferase n=1 Tax=Clathrospora elynae TaxID=706981 RepID=A0A6A5SV43_9PLEO|nr:S-adenosyl-L-methionine-dependent methyltransferase [Clathrospora elynae]
MSSRRRIDDDDDIDDASQDDDDVFEVPLIDLTDSEDAAAPGPVDIRNRSTNFANREQARNQAVAASRAKKNERSSAEEEKQFCRRPDGSIIKVGHTVELKQSGSRGNGLQSGDFIKVVNIIRDSTTAEIRLRGHRYMREKYLLGQGSDGSHASVNELMMHFEVHEDDNRPAQVQGLVDISPTEIKDRRDITHTQKPYPMLSFREQPARRYSHLRSKDEIKREIFHRGLLVCRWSRTSIISPNGSAYGGILRLLSRKQTMTPLHLRGSQPQTPQPISKPILHADALRGARLGKRPMRTPSLEELHTPPLKRAATHPFKKKQYTFFDMFCGAGGASRGADNAGLQVLGGLDFDQDAMIAWENNNTGGLPFCTDAFVFLENGSHKIVGRVDILSISNPCQPFSPAHTITGKNDELNINALGAIPLALLRFKPRLLIIENTSGLCTHAKNKQHFNRLLRSIMLAGPGYNIIYKVVNMADYGVPQVRKRLILIAAKRGTPLPPIPKPTHGPPGSSLKPYVSIGDALEVIERLGDRAYKDKYHRPNDAKSLDSQPYDAYSKFVDCIMTSGVTTCHPSGKRMFTPRELALLQSLPIYHRLTGSPTNAVKQVGNMFPPLMAELVYQSCAQTLEAFDHGLIHAEEELDDLDITLIEKGVNIPKLLPTPSSLVDLTSSSGQTQSPYRYLTRPGLSDAIYSAYTSAWARRKISERLAPQGRKKRATRIPWSDEYSGFENPSPLLRERKQPVRKNRLEEKFWERHHGKFIDLIGYEDDDDVV